jgi:phage-related protein
VHGIPQLVGGGIQMVGSGVGALFQKAGSWLGDKVECVPVLENLVQPLTDLLSGAGAVIADVFNGIGEAADSLGGAFESLFEGDLGGFAEGIGDAVGDVAGGVADAVGDAVDAVGDAVSDFFSGW